MAGNVYRIREGGDRWERESGMSLKIDVFDLFQRFEPQPIECYKEKVTPGPKLTPNIVSHDA